MTSKDFTSHLEPSSSTKSIRSRTPLPSLLEQGYSTKAIKSRSNQNSKNLKQRRYFKLNLDERSRIGDSLDNFRRGRKPKLLLLFLGIVVGIYLVYLKFSGLIVLGKFKLRDLSFEKGWIKECKLRKKPLLFLKTIEEISIIWETNCEENFTLSYGTTELIKQASWFSSKKVNVTPIGIKEAERIKIKDKNNNHFLYRVNLKDLKGGLNYTYSLTRTSPTKNTTIATYSFPFTSSSTLSPTPSTSKIYIAALSDNQYNIRTFHSLLLRLISYYSSLPFSPSPNFLIHGGDNVQNPNNLKQWQTDFWDPLTQSLPTLEEGNLGSNLPLLLARGNHDFDKTGQNFYTGGSPKREDYLNFLGFDLKKEKKEKEEEENNNNANYQEEEKIKIGTYMSYSPHSRIRILILDSNLNLLKDIKEQEEWLLWELNRTEWKEASLKLVIVHVPPFLEYWDEESWTKGNESTWGAYVRTSLTPILSLHSTTLIISGHQHAYSRGFLPTSLITPFTTSPNSSSLKSSFALAAAKERSWTKLLSQTSSSSSSPSTSNHNALNNNNQYEPGIIYTIIGGGGGTFDFERVEDWGFYEKSITGKHFFIWIELEFNILGTPLRGRIQEQQQQQKKKERNKNMNDDEKKRLYRVRGNKNCKVEEEEEEEVERKVDTLEWKVIGLKGEILDSFRIESDICLRS